MSSRSWLRTCSTATRAGSATAAYALYTGRAGLTEDEVRRSGTPALIATRPLTRVSRAIEKAENAGFMAGFMKVVDAESNQILGASLLGTGCDEVIRGILDVMYAKAPYIVLQRTMPIHPTVSELPPTLLGDLQPLHRS